MALDAPRRNPALAPPFSKEKALRSSTQTLFPRIFRRNSQLFQTSNNFRSFLSNELETPRLNKVQGCLWLAGQPRPARFLHRQCQHMRTIILTESPDEHLVWHDTSIWIKPVPEFLLDYTFWERELCCDEALFKSAYGLLISYTWLICYKSDHRIAQNSGILPPDINYESWANFVSELLVSGGLSVTRRMNKRYIYGELRLSRLNHLYRLGAAGFSLRNLVFGFASASTRFPTFFQRNFGWILAVFVYFSVFLSALQVALATERLGTNNAFQSFAFGIAILAIAFVLVAIAMVLLVWCSLFSFHFLSSFQTSRKTKYGSTATTDDSFF
ncbi:hypothetical protein GGR57DRAFT_88700 [Xylariaceae sp. FL1272]|nr:hypothetical protein GGR57DRAFT_88700 [Xylariaceae sp. FL1272]